MLSLAIKQSEKIDLYTLLLKSVEEANGPQVSAQLEPTFKKLQQLRDDLLQISNFRNDGVAMEKLADEAKTYVSIWAGISQSFTFGSERGSINTRFTWYDSYTREKKATTNPMTERLAMLYNLAVIYSQIGTNLTISVEDKLKPAAAKFLTAAWIFDKLKAEVGNLTTPDIGIDLTEQNLHMCGYIMRAEAQYCAHEKVKRTSPNSYALLAKLAMQAAVYYGRAYGYTTTPPVCKAVDPKTFVSVLQFYESSFMAQAYYWAALNNQKVCDETTVGIGKAIACIRKAMEYLNALQKLEKSLSPAIATQYKELVKVFSEKKAYLEDQNSKIYHETVPSKVDEIELMPFGQPAETELSKPFEGQEILSRMVPPAVRELEEEYKKEVGAMMGQAFEITRQAEAIQGQFLAKYNLPAALHAVSGEQDLPDDLWTKIKQCKEKGGLNGLLQVLSGVATLAENNNSTLKKLFEQLAQEEAEDQAMRTKYGSTWSRLPSASLNQAYKKQLEYYKQKYDQGKAADDKVRGLIESKKELLSMVEMDKATLATKIPKPQGPTESMSPAAAKYCFQFHLS